MHDDATYVLALDQGTSSTKAVAITAGGHVHEGPGTPVSIANPRPGWVEQDPAEIFVSVMAAITAMTDAMPGTVSAIGLSTQRESAVAWDAATGEPIGPMLGWQDRRTSDRATALKETHGDLIRNLSGLPADPMFSALKFEWLLDEVDPDRARSRNGKIRLGTVDSWIVDKLAGAHQIEAGNASRTQLIDIQTADWDQDLLDLFRIPRQALPQIVSSDHVTPIQGDVSARISATRVSGVLGDSHAALFAHGVREPGAVKATYGTGSSIMGLTDRKVAAASGLVETIAWQTDRPVHAFEGNILATGATLVWLSNLLDIPLAKLTELAGSVPDAAAVNVVPAFSGLGAPWWDENAVAVMDGFDLGTTRAHLARAALESIPLQIEDVLAHADHVVGTRIETVLADGGPAKNDWLMQCQADLSDRRVLRPTETCLSAVGAAHMAGIGAGVWSPADVERLTHAGDEFEPSLLPDSRTARLDSWERAVARSRAPASTRTTKPRDLPIGIMQ